MSHERLIWLALLAGIVILGGSVGLECLVGFSRFLSGGSAALVAAATALVTIWGILLGFGSTTLAAVFHLSALPGNWKVWLLHQGLRTLWVPLMLHAAIAGIIPFVALFRVPDDALVSTSLVTALLIGALPLVMLFGMSAAMTVQAAYRSLSLIPAIRRTLSTLGSAQLQTLKKAHEEVFKEDVDQHRHQGLLPMSPYATDPRIAKVEEHKLLVTVLATLFREADNQALDEGVYEVSRWAQMVDLKQIDSYLQYRALPLCISEIKLRCYSDAPAALDARIYHFCRLLNVLGREGATLTCANAVNSVWEVIVQQSQVWGMSATLSRAKMGIEVLLAGDRLRRDTFSYALHNIGDAIVPLAREKSTHSREWFNIIMEWHRQHLEAVIFPMWPIGREQVGQLIGVFLRIFSAVEDVYCAELAELYTMVDVRYWVLVLLRRLQESFAERLQGKGFAEEDRALAGTDYEQFESTIAELLSVRIPPGEPDAYKAVRVPTNPFD